MNRIASGAAVLELRGVGVCYSTTFRSFRREARWAVRDISFDLRHGETLGIIGNNGAGKSTILKVLAGIIQPDQGEMILHEPARASLIALQVGFIPHLTGRENIFLAGMFMGLSRSDIEDRIDDIVAFAELGEFIDAPVKTYSVGMRARLGFSIAFQADPDILLIDEVLGVGDRDFRRKSKRAMRAKIQSNRTVVLVSHNTDTVRELCDRVVWIERGRTVEVGPAGDVLDRYLSANPGGNRPCA